MLRYCERRGTTEVYESLGPEDIPSPCQEEASLLAVECVRDPRARFFQSSSSRFRLPPKLRDRAPHIERRGAYIGEEVSGLEMSAAAAIPNS
jgi:hypothetical protein